MRICKVNLEVDKNTKIEFFDDEALSEPEIVISMEGALVEIFGTKEELIKFANDLHKAVHKKKTT